MIRLAVLMVTEKAGLRPETAPSTAGLVSESQVLAVVLIQGPTTWAPPMDGKSVTHEST